MPMSHRLTFVCVTVAALAFAPMVGAQPPDVRGMESMEGMRGPHGPMGKPWRGGEEGGRDRGARFKLERGDSKIDIRCSPSDNTSVCVDAALRVINLVLGGRQQTARGPEDAQRQGGPDEREPRGFDGRRGPGGSF